MRPPRLSSHALPSARMLCSLRTPSTFHRIRFLSRLRRLARPLARGCTLANSAYTHTELAYQYANVNAHLIFSRPPLVPLVHAAFKSLGYSESDIRACVVMVTSQWLTGADAANLVRLEALSGHGAIESEVRFDGEQANETL